MQSQRKAFREERSEAAEYKEEKANEMRTINIPQLATAETPDEEGSDKERLRGNGQWHPHRRRVPYEQAPLWDVRTKTLP